MKNVKNKKNRFSFPLVKGNICLGNSSFLSLSGQMALQTGCRAEFTQPQMQKEVPYRTNQEGKTRKRSLQKNKHILERILRVYTCHQVINIWSKISGGLFA